jgi:hypothetical protein
VPVICCCKWGSGPPAVNNMQSNNFRPETDVSIQQQCEHLMLHVFVYGNVSVMLTLLMAVSRLGGNSKYFALFTLQFG